MVARISKSNKATTMKSILTQLHLQQYLPTFQKHDIDFTIFLTLNEQTLKIIGIKNESHCKILILWIKKLQQLLLTSTNNNNDISTLTINTKKLLSEINNDDVNDDDDDKDYDEEGGEEEEEEEDDDDQIIIDEQLILETVQNNNKKLLTPITEEDSDESSSFFFYNNNNNNSDDSDDGDDDDSKSDVGIILNSATPQIIDYNSTVPIPEYSEVDLINTQRSNDENHDDINEIDVNDNNTHYYYHNPQSAISTSTLATSASITTLPSYTPFTTSTLLRSLSKNSYRSSKSSKLTKLSLSSRIFNGGGGGGGGGGGSDLTVVESDSNNNNNNNMIMSNINNKSKNKRKHQSVLNPKNWRHSMPLIPSISSLLPSSSLSSVQSSSPPSYFDIVVDDYNDKKSDHQSDIIALATNDKSKYNVDCDNEENELLPEYSCTVNHSGYVLIKKEFTRKGLKATKRSWQKRYLYLWGTFLRIYAHEPVNINIAKPIHRFSMQDAQVELAIDYPKRKYVLRIKFKTGHQYLIHADDKEECVTWIERLQSSCNISSTLDERQMPMFITLPTRRRNNGGNISSGIDATNIIHNDGYDNYSTSFAPTSLTYQRFNEIAREIQQVQITNSSINYQLSW